MAIFTNYAHGAIVLLTAGLAYITLSAVYRLTLHPLAKFPGPFLAKISDWHLFIKVSNGDQHLYLQRLHEQYGDVVRTSPNKLSFRTVEAMHDIYADRKANQIKTGFTDIHAALSGAGDLQNLTDRQVHAARKRKVASAFSDEALRSAEEFILKHIRTWLSLMCSSDKDAEWSKTRNMKEWTQFLTVDILGDLAFGQSFKAMETEKTLLPAVIDDSVKLLTLIAIMPLKSIAILILKVVSVVAGFFGSTGNVSDEYKALIKKMVEERLQLENEGDNEKLTKGERLDFFHYLLQARDPETGQGLTMLELVNEAGLLVGAGYDTTAATLDTCLWYLTHNPSVLQKLQDQIRTTFTNVEEIRMGPKLASLSYLRACIDESLRMSSPVSGVLDRIVLKGGMTIDGHYVPAGTIVNVPIYALHHNESYYPDAWSFKPERWIPTENADLSNEDQVVQARKAFFAFSAGPRVCIGKNLAYMNMSISLARLLYSFDIQLGASLSDGAGDVSLPASTGRHRSGEYQLEDWFLNRRAGTKLKFKLAK